MRPRCKNPGHFPDSYQNPWQFQVFQTSDHSNYKKHKLTDVYVTNAHCTQLYLLWVSCSWTHWWSTVLSTATHGLSLHHITSSLVTAHNSLHHTHTSQHSMTDLQAFFSVYQLLQGFGKHLTHVTSLRDSISINNTGSMSWTAALVVKFLYQYSKRWQVYAT